MCNIAGYIGTRPAAPILLDMMRREEGFAGGYYTGIATWHEGKIHYAKLTGDTDRLVALTEAASLPGTVGIIHSRSNSGGGDAWAHPFVGTARDGTVTAAYVANGSVGCFKPRSARRIQQAEQLLAQGYTMLSRERAENSNYQKLSDGTTVHMSDTMCQLITRNLERGLDSVHAMGEAFCEMPSEIVGLMLTCADPESITYARINMPMMLAFAPHGAYLASTAFALPEDADEPLALPPCSMGRILRDRWESAPLPNPPARVAPLTADVRHAAFVSLCEALEEGEQTFSQLRKRLIPLFSPADCQPAALLAYDVLLSLHRAGRLHIETRRVPGAVPQIDAPKVYLTMKRIDP